MRQFRIWLSPRLIRAGDLRIVGSHLSTTTANERRQIIRSGGFDPDRKGELNKRVGDTVWPNQFALKGALEGQNGRASWNDATKKAVPKRNTVAELAMPAHFAIVAPP